MSPETAFSIPTPAGSRHIGGDAPCFVIAEVGTNWHFGDSNDDSVARQMIELAAEAGCDAVKFQTYRPETVYVANPGESDYLSAAGIRRSILDVIRERMMPADMLPGLAEHARACGLVFMSSCFSLEDFALVDPLTPIHKMASYEITLYPLIEAIARSGKPMIMSTGAAAPQDVAWAVDCYRAAGGTELSILQCTASYPAPDEAMNLRALAALGREFGAVPGLSDHSPHALHAPFAAVALGAKVIEKHFTVDKSGPGPDHFNSIMPDELAAMVRGIRAIEAMLGDGVKKVEPIEEELHAFARRRVQAIRDIAAGEALVVGQNIAILRPGKRVPGAHPHDLPALSGQRVSREIATGDGVTLADLAP
ncbi:N-acetylneuraminate synthase family protein [Insolitispirillum peregrinum]